MRSSASSSPSFRGYSSFLLSYVSRCTIIHEMNDSLLRGCPVPGQGFNVPNDDYPGTRSRLFNSATTRSSIRGSAPEPSTTRSACTADGLTDRVLPAARIFCSYCIRTDSGDLPLSDTSRQSRRSKQIPSAASTKTRRSYKGSSSS